jgi:phosphatidylglycerophosphate synthase
VLEKDDRMKKSQYLIVVALRFLLTPIFFYAFILDFTEVAIFLYLAAFVSDIADGRLAKRQNAIPSSFLEAYLDPIADFTLILVSFYAFSLREFYPFWVLFVFVLMFLFFVISSNARTPLYDPVGKYYGTFLMTTIGITLLFSMDIIYNGILLSIVTYTLGLVIYRTVFLWKKRKGNVGVSSMSTTETS